MSKFMIEAVARIWPFANGSGRFLDLYAKRINLGTGERLALTSDGFELHVLADDLIGRHILLSGKFDRSIVQVLLDQAREGDVLLDIGANIGYVAACFLANVKNSHAICIDPQPQISNLLRKNMAQFGERATVHQVALSDRTGELRFHIDEANRGHSRICDNGEIVVQAMNALDLLAPMEKLDLIKIDVEGHEEPILRALKQGVARLRPRAILFEDQTGAAKSRGGIGSILAELDYSVFGIKKSLFKTQLIPVRPTSDCRWNDYVAIADHQ